ncbi:hypothetical protein O1611_g9347 [Lasiodiplodia mahajangana]|uniref:Uncharacterized protein n=1 Tax=Lasiodiplodia mahajangana TaxID=1108764 RepID=A0ACC2J9V9_9PEZI|nr:hypothetical protein O1611_g9347 [Lasiodiplodia mahajangana]
MWNRACGYGFGWADVEQQAWTNINAFAARLTASETADFDHYAVWALSAALEEEIQHSSLHRDASDSTQLSLLLTVASVWIQIAGKHLYERHVSTEEPGQSDAEIDLATRGTFPWTLAENQPLFCNARWRFWSRRFAQEAENGELPEAVREMAAKSAEIIDDFQQINEVVSGVRHATLPAYRCAMWQKWTKGTIVVTGVNGWAMALDRKTAGDPREI